MKLNNIINRRNLTVYGFPAFAGLAEKSNKDACSAVLSTLPPATMLEAGIRVYFAPVIPRNSRFCTPDEIVAADLDCNLVRVTKADEIKPDDEVVIVSRHPGTVSLLRDACPNNVVLDQVTEDDIKGKTVVGTLPPHLVQFAGRYQSVTIRDFDYARDGDISGVELEERLVFGAPVTVEVFSEDVCPHCGANSQPLLVAAPDSLGYTYVYYGNEAVTNLLVCPKCRKAYVSNIEMVEAGF